MIIIYRNKPALVLKKWKSLSKNSNEFLYKLLWNNIIVASRSSDLDKSYYDVFIWENDYVDKNKYELEKLGWGDLVYDINASN